MMKYWLRFDKNGGLNAEDLPKWPRYEILTDHHIVPAETMATGTALRKEACDMLTPVYAALEPLKHGVR